MVVVTAVAFVVSVDTTAAGVASASDSEPAAAAGAAAAGASVVNKVVALGGGMRCMARTLSSPAQFHPAGT